MKDAFESEEELLEEGVWDRALLGRLLLLARPHARLFRQSFGVLVLLFLFELAGPWLLRATLDGPVADALAARRANPDADLSGSGRQIALFGGAFLLASLAVMGLRYLEAFQLGRTGQTVIHDLRTRLFDAILTRPVTWFHGRRTGSLVTRVTADVDNLNELFTSGLIAFGFDLVKIVLLLGVLFWLQPALTAAVLAATPLLILVSLVFRGGSRRAWRAVRVRLAQLNGYLQEVLSGIGVVQAFGREDRVRARFGERSRSAYEAAARSVLVFALFFPAIDLVIYALQGAIVWIGGLAILEGRTSHGAFVQYWFYLMLYLRPIRELGERYNVLQSAFAAAERVFELLDGEERRVAVEPGPGPSAEGAAPASPFERIRFDDVSFAYGAGGDAVEGVSFSIERGQTVALVGATGAGKSTLVGLLLRQFAPRAGRIWVDEQPLEALPHWGSRLGLVLQEDFLFNGTVRENLTLGREGISDAQLDSALRAARAQGVLAKRAGGLEARVEERGATFSSGERELLGLARAFAGDPELVVLDEATANVDSSTEAAIEAATAELLEGRSALVVAHRLSTVRRADVILVLHEGRIVERGTHRELLRQGGRYARLHALDAASN